MTSRAAPPIDSSRNPPRAEEIEEDRLRRRRAIIKLVLVADCIIVIVSWIILAFFVRISQMLNYYPPYNVISGPSLILIAVVTFLGFYLASLDEGTDRGHAMRNAITAAFVILYLVMLPYVLVGPEYFSALFGGQSSTISGGSAGLSEEQYDRVRDSIEYGRNIFSGFTSFITTVLAFYFVSQVIEGVARNRETGQTQRAEIEAAAQVEAARVQNQG
jgi:hypothetical protein